MLENRSRDYVEHRIRAGVLEQGTVDLLRDAGVGEPLDREGIVHHGINLQFDGERHHVPLTELSGGQSIVIYGQTEVVKDLVAARDRRAVCRCCSRSKTSASHDIETRAAAHPLRDTTASRTSSSATSSPAATAFTASAARASRPAC